MPSTVRGERIERLVSDEEVVAVGNLRGLDERELLPRGGVQLSMRRINPLLRLAALTLSLAAPAMSSARTEAIVRGRVLAGPTCPVERPGDPGCAPRPVIAVVTVSTLSGRVIGTIRSSASGRFTLRPVSGAYLLKPRALSGALPRGRVVLIQVLTGRITHVVLSMDTGIR